MKLNIRPVRRYPDPKGKTYLCLDVAFAHLGAAVYDVEADGFIYGACIDTKIGKDTAGRKSEDDLRRCYELGHPVNDLIKIYKCSVVFAELPYGSPNSLTAKMMGMAVGVIAGIFVTLPQVTLIPIQPNHSKNIVGKRGTVSKQDTIRFIERRYGSKYMPPNNKKEHVADAMMTIEVAKKAFPQYFHKNNERRKTDL